MVTKRYVAQHVLSLQNLAGGSYGTLELVVLNPAELEVRLGADFVRLSREQTKSLCQAAIFFLDIGRPERRASRAVPEATETGPSEPRPEPGEAEVSESDDVVVVVQGEEKETSSRQNKESGMAELSPPRPARKTSRRRGA